MLFISYFQKGNYHTSKTIKISFLCLLVIFIFSMSAFSQILNIEKAKIPRDSAVYLFSNGAISWRIFNRSAAADDPVKFFGLNGNINVGYFSKKHSYQWLNSLDYLVINENPFTSFAFSHFRINFMRSQKISYELFSQGQYDLWRGLKWRIIGGGGLRMMLFNEHKTSLILGTGIFYENETWKIPNTENELINVNALKSSTYVTFRTDLKEYLSFNMINYYQIGRDDVFNRMRQRWSVDANFNVKLSAHFDFKVSFSAAYENRPIVPITKFIYTLSNGIQYRLEGKND